MTKALSGLLLAPLALAAASSTAVFLYGALSHVDATLFLLLGAAAYPAFHKALSKTGYAYVAAHECSHALAALLSGVKIKKISVGRRGGYVLLDAGNAFITLAPYFVPFYAVAAALSYFLAGFFINIAPARPYFLALSGFLISFHALSTAEILAGPVQSDIKKAGGRAFSYSAILALNSLAASIMVKLLFPELFSFGAYLKDIYLRAGAIFVFLGKAAIYCFNTAKIYMN